MGKPKGGQAKLRCPPIGGRDFVRCAISTFLFCFARRMVLLRILRRMWGHLISYPMLFSFCSPLLANFGLNWIFNCLSGVESDDELASGPRASVPNGKGHQPPPSSASKPFKRGRRARSTLRSFLGRFAHRGNSLQDLRPSPRSVFASLPELTKFRSL